MRRRLLGVLGFGTAAVMMLSGFDSAMTVQDLQKNAAEAMKTVQQYSGTFSAGADVNVTVTQEGENGASMSMPLTGEITGSFSMTREPMAAGIELEFSGSGAGQEGSGSLQLFMNENEDGTGTSYVHTVSGGTDSGWQAAAVDAESIAQMKSALDQVASGDINGFLDQYTTEDSDLNADQMKELIATYTQTLQGAATLSSEAVEANGHEAYEVVADITGGVLTQLISDSAAVAGQVLDESMLGLIETIASSLDIKVVTDYDVETCLPVAGFVDLTGSDFASLAQFAAGLMGSEEIGSVELTANRLGAEFSVSYDDFGGVVIPEEALSAEVVDAGDALDSLVGDVTAIAGGGTDDSDYSDYDPTEGAVFNEDGSCHLEDENYEGAKLAVDVYAPEGMECSYAAESYVAYSDEDYRKNISYSLYSYANADEALGYMTDVSYMTDDEDYSDIVVTDPAELTLESGVTIKYATVSYKYQGTAMGSTYAVIPVEDMAVMVEMRIEDENYEPVVPTEEEIAAYASVVKTA